MRGVLGTCGPAGRFGLRRWHEHERAFLGAEEVADALGSGSNPTDTCQPEVTLEGGARAVGAAGSSSDSAQGVLSWLAIVPRPHRDHASSAFSDTYGTDGHATMRVRLRA